MSSLKNMMSKHAARPFWEQAAKYPSPVEFYFPHPPRDCYGSFDRVFATGRARCRACGEKIAKGSLALRFGYDFYGHGSHTCIEVFLHADPCISLE